MKELNTDRIVYRKYPVLIWTFSIFAISVAVFMMYHFTFGSFLFKYKEHSVSGWRLGYWWEYGAAGLIFGIGYIFISAAVIETTVFDRKKGLLEVRRTRLGFDSLVTSYLLTDIVDVYCVKDGVKSRSTDTIHFKVTVEFTHCADLEVMESRQI